MIKEHHTRPPRDWRKHWHHYAVHVLVGGLIASGLFLSAPWPLASALGATFFMWYQYLEFLRLGDTPSRDVADAGIGFALFLVVIAIVGWVA